MDNEKYFIVPVGKEYALFKFMPYYQMKSILDVLKISYEMCDTRDDVKKHLPKKYKQVEAKQTPLTRYKIDIDDPIYSFFFVSDVIDKILDFYKIKYDKEVHK